MIGKLYPAYSEYKDSGVEWLGEIPKYWEVKRLKNIASCNDESLGENTDPDYTIEYVDISSVNLLSGITHYENMIFENAPSRARRKVKNGDIIVSTVRTYLKAIATIKKPPNNLIVSTGFAVIRPKQDLNPDYIGYLLQSEGFIGDVVSNSSGVSYPAIDSSILMRLPVVEPPLEEQETIAKFLDTATAEIDDIIEQQQQLISLLEEERTTVISHAVTKGIDRSVPMKDSGVEWLGEIPEHWETKKAKHVSSIFVPQRNKPELNLDSGVPWITMDDITSPSVDSSITGYYVNELDALTAGSKVLPPGCVIASCVGNFGVASVNKVSVIINQQLQAYIPKKIDSWFLRYLVEVSKQYFEKVATATTLVYVNQERFGELPIVLPPIEEQKAICNFINQETAKIDEAIAIVQQQIELLEEYRTTLISDAVTGKIDVRGIANEKS
ncbi:restriction endonuclease subunit S [Floridanema evergladense]|uniref:Restriction endonuclease subunit S n=1 Tax=Floridaenema evergladense BLCC-F167 TaxID=3153639 RepID=A0ABV4WPM2_9CYAN